MYTETVMFFGVGMKGSLALRGRDYKWDIFQDRLRLVIALKAHEGGFFFFYLECSGRRYCRQASGLRPHTGMVFVWFNQKKKFLWGATMEGVTWSWICGSKWARPLLLSIGSNEPTLLKMSSSGTSRITQPLTPIITNYTLATCITHPLQSPQPDNHTHRRTHTSKIFQVSEELRKRNFKF